MFARFCPVYRKFRVLRFLDPQLERPCRLRGLAQDRARVDVLGGRPTCPEGDTRAHCPSAWSGNTGLAEGRVGRTVPRILIAEDDDGVRSVLAQQLSRAGYEVLEATDGRRCLEVLRTTPVDLVVLDIFMPELDGIAVIARASRDFAHVRILAISGGGTVARDQTLEIARRLGATRTLSKPFAQEEFVSAVRELLGEP